MIGAALSALFINNIPRDKRYFVSFYLKQIIRLVRETDADINAAEKKQRLTENCCRCIKETDQKITGKCYENTKNK